MSYRKRLAAIDQSRSLMKPARARLILLTGQSSFASSRLSPAQADFLKSVTLPGVEPVMIGFPYHAEFDCSAPSFGLAAASIRNALQFSWSLFSPAYRCTVARVLQGVLRNTGESLYIITGSCGLQILASAWPILNIPENLRVRVVAVGPALLDARTLPVEAITTVQGHRDLCSRLLYRWRPEARCDSDHLGYWSSREVRDVVRQLLRDAKDVS